MGDVFKIVGCSTVSEPGGFDGRKHHPVTATWTREHEARQAGWRNARAVHGNLSVPAPQPSPDQFVKESTNICALHKFYATIFCRTQPNGSFFTLGQPSRWLEIKDQVMVFARNTPKSAKASMTFGNGGEFAAHKSLRLDTYFCDPHSPWQNGVIENAIGRLRRDLPRKTTPDNSSEDAFDTIIAIHNDTPRKCLRFRTPAEVFRHQIDKQRWT
jgi:hypothetical protein